MDFDVIAVVGPTACGKTRRAVEIAQAFHGEIISADSRQVYRGMDIGTGKDLDEYGDVPYHIIDIKPAGYKYNLHEFLQDYRCAKTDIASRGKLPVLCGGTGMYVESALSGLRLPEVPENPDLRIALKGKSLPELIRLLSSYKTLHATSDIDTPQRAIRAIEIQDYYLRHPEDAALADRSKTRQESAIIIGLDIPREKRRERISARLRSRLQQGMIQEVKALLDSGIDAEDLIYYGLEYKFVTLHVIGKLSYEEMVRQLEIAIHQFAKRQMTWFRGMERRGFKINWIPYDLPTEDFLIEVRRLCGLNA